MDVVRGLSTAIDALGAADPSTLADGESIVALAPGGGPAGGGR